MDILGEKVKEAAIFISESKNADQHSVVRDASGEIQKPSSDDDVNVLNGPNDVDVAIRPDVHSNDVKVQICGLSVSFVCNCFSREKK